MIVDDQLGIQLLLEEIVKSTGHQAIIAGNGKEALDMIEKEFPDLLIVDYKLPIIDGFRLISQLEETGIFIPTILMSGLADEIAEKAEKMQSVQYIFAKPFDIDVARTQINRLLG